MKRILLFLSVLLMSTMLFAGNPEFKVKQVSGDAQIKKSGKWEKLSSGSSLAISDQIKLGNGSKVTLDHSSGKSINVDKSGFYSVAKLAAKAKTNKTNVSSKLASSLLDELSDSDDLLASGNVNDNMATLGAVERAFNNKFTSSSIMASLPRSSYSVDNTVNFTWNPLQGATSYKFEIKNGIDEIVYSKEVSATELSVNLDEAKVPFDECYYWMVSSGDKTSEEFCIFRMNADQAASIKSEIENLKGELDLSNSLDNMILAKFFADNKIVTEATQYFEKAIELDSEVAAYKVMYAKYLLSIGLNEEAMAVVK